MSNVKNQRGNCNIITHMYSIYEKVCFFFLLQWFKYYTIDRFSGAINVAEFGGVFIGSIISRLAYILRYPASTTPFHCWGSFAYQLDNNLNTMIFLLFFARFSLLGWSTRRVTVLLQISSYNISWNVDNSIFFWSWYGSNREDEFLLLNLCSIWPSWPG